MTHIDLTTHVSQYDEIFIFFNVDTWSSDLFRKLTKNTHTYTKILIDRLNDDFI